MIAIDLSPLAFAPRRGVARALLNLLEGLDRTRLHDLYLRGYLPRVPLTSLGLRPGMRWSPKVIGPERPSPRQWRAALAEAVERDGSAVLLSPWAAFPRTRVPVVVWIHEVPWVRSGSVEGAVRTQRHRLALARAARRAAALVVPTDAVRGDLLAVHPEAAERVQVVAHGFLPRRFELAGDSGGVPGTAAHEVSAAAPLREMPSYGVWYVDRPRERFVPPTVYALLLGTGRGAAGPWKKGVDVATAAFEDTRLAGIDLVCVGALPSGNEAHHVVEEPDDLEVATLLKGARMVIVPSRSEGFGFPVLEGFASGVPVVASAANALTEVAGGAARLVPIGDVDALAEAVLRVHTDEALRTRLIKAGHRRAQEFPVEAMAAGWLRVLTKAGGIAWHG